MTLRQRIRLYQQLATLIRAGIPLVKSLERLKDKANKPVIEQLHQVIQQGGSPSEAFASARFSSFECHLIEVGANSAKLELIFEHLAQFWTYEADLWDTIWVQLGYPLVVLHFTVLVSSLSGYISGGFLGFGIALAENLFQLYAFAGILGMVIYFMSRIEAGIRFWLVWPVIGYFLRTTFAFRWITALRLEYSAGIPLPDAVADAWRASIYPGYAALAVQSAEKLREGEELSTLMRKWPLLPRDWIDFVETGEISGALESTFLTLGEEAAKASDLAQKQMRNWMPKILYFVIVIVSAIQILNMLWNILISPIDSINNALNQI